MIVLCNFKHFKLIQHVECIIIPIKKFGIQQCIVSWLYTAHLAKFSRSCILCTNTHCKICIVCQRKYFFKGSNVNAHQDNCLQQCSSGTELWLGCLSSLHGQVNFEWTLHHQTGNTSESSKCLMPCGNLAVDHLFNNNLQHVKKNLVHISSQKIIIF